ncbi:MAG TPA: hypothetical protein EYP78_02370 [Candidatus Omnitrophica bacterium]|nr:hypothetical protein [Candidatus Omnitrophota bacterium]
MGEKLLTIFQKIEELEDPLKRRLLALAVLTKRLEEEDYQPVLIGGFALEYYTLGGYTTTDVDIALPSSPRIDAIFSEFGFKKEGRFWFHQEYDLLFEAPTSKLEGENAPLTEVEIEGLKCYIIGVEDLIIDRLNGFAYWNWQDDKRWAIRLLELNRDKLDLNYLKKRAKDESTLKALQGILEEIKYEKS